MKPFRFESFILSKIELLSLNLSISTNSSSSDLSAQISRIQMKNNLGKQYSIGNPYEIWHPTLSEEQHLFYRKLKFRTYWKKSYCYTRLSHDRPARP